VDEHALASDEEGVRVRDLEIEDQLGGSLRRAGRRCRYEPNGGGAAEGEGGGSIACRIVARIELRLRDTRVGDDWQPRAVLSWGNKRRILGDGPTSGVTSPESGVHAAYHQLLQTPSLWRTFGKRDIVKCCG
jgi:hypothetical protein